jgi:hypothetical protein
MARRQQHDLVAARHGRADRVHLLREPRPAHPVVEPREGLERRHEPLALAPDLRRELVEDALLLRGDRELRLTPRVRQVDGHERLDEQGLAAAGLVVDDAAHAASRLGPDRDDVAPVPERHDGLLERAHELGMDERVEARPEAFVGDAHGAPEAAQLRRGRIGQPATGLDGGLQPRAQHREWGDRPVEVVQEGLRLLAQPVGEP